jgi:hypothetical protein
LFYFMFRIEANGNITLLTILTKILADFRHKTLRNPKHRPVFFRSFSLEAT